MIQRALLKVDHVRELISPAPIPPWIRIAQREVGVREIRGGENKRILEYSKATPFPQTEDEVPWCSFFMNWVMMQANCERTGSGLARSWLAGDRLPRFKKHCIVVTRRGSSSWQGHVFFGMDLKNGRIRGLGGNQSDSVNYSYFPESLVLGYVWPKLITAA